MTISIEIEQLLRLPYRRDNGPNNKPPLLTEGVNCQLLTHKVLAILFEVNLPAEMLSKEIFEDQVCFSELRPEEAKLGDVFIFGKQEEQDFRRLHLAVYVDRDNHANTPILLHASGIDGRVSLWPLDKFSQYPRYQKLYAVKRLNYSS